MVNSKRRLLIRAKKKSYSSVSPWWEAEQLQRPTWTVCYLQAGNRKHRPAVVQIKLLSTQASFSWLFWPHSNINARLSLHSKCYHHHSPQTWAAWSSPHVSGTCGPCLCLGELLQSVLADQQQKSKNNKNDKKTTTRWGETAYIMQWSHTCL